MTIWEEYGFTLEEYAKAFNEELDKAWERQIKGKMYFISITEPIIVRRIVNIKPPE